MKNKEAVILFLLAGLNFTHILDFMIMMPLGNYLMPYFHIQPGEFSMLVSAYSYSAFVSGIIAAFLVNSFDRKKVLLLSYLGFIIGTFACGLADSYLLLLLARVVTGLFGGIIGAQVLAIVADLFPYERRGRAMGAVMSAFAVASVLGVPFSLYLTNIFNFNWHVPFLLVGGIGLIFLVLIRFFIPGMTDHIRTGEDRLPTKDMLRNAIPDLSQGSTLLFSGLLMMGHFLIIPFINPYMEFNKGFSKDQTPLIYLFGGLASFLAAFLLGRYADRVGKLPVFSVSVFLSLFMVLLITRMPTVPLFIALIFFAVWFILATGRAITAQAMISEVVGTQKRGSFMSLNGSVQQLGTGFASSIAGMVVLEGDGGKILRFDWLGYLSIIVLLASLVLGRILFRKMDETRVARAW